MENAGWVTALQACVPILVALVGIIPTIIANRKKTQESIAEMQSKLVKDINDTRGEVTDLKGEVATLQTGLDEHMAEEEEHRAKQCRYRFLRFYDEMCAGMRHSESHFEDVLDDIDFYEEYCEKHKKFRNNRGKVAMEYIKETYAKLKKSGEFLSHKEGD